jgi:tagatose 1,6-diphosphate aldolase
MFLIRSVFAAASNTGAAAFLFRDPGELIDGELELIAPEERWIPAMLESCHHAGTCAAEPEHAGVSRQQLRDFLKHAPGGHEPPDPSRQRVPTYHFWMRLHPDSDPAVPIAGTISLRIGNTPDIQLYFGHIGYGVYAPARGRHYAERACRLLLPLARLHGLDPLWVTTDPDNAPSRRTCERLGGKMVEIVDLPPDHILHQRGQVRKCRYRVDF